MKTITIQIGNSDDKLTQLEWSHYASAVKRAVELMAHEVHFSGGSPNWHPWQNRAWVIVSGNDDAMQTLKADLRLIRTAFNQDSIAWTVGETEFI